MAALRQMASEPGMAKGPWDLVLGRFFVTFARPLSGEWRGGSLLQGVNGSMEGEEMPVIMGFKKLRCEVQGGDRLWGMWD